MQSYTNLLCVPAGRDGGLSSLDYHDPPHVLETGVRGHHSLQRDLVVLRHTCTHITEHTHHTHTHTVSHTHTLIHVPTTSVLNTTTLFVHTCPTFVCACVRIHTYIHTYIYIIITCNVSWCCLCRICVLAAEDDLGFSIFVYTFIATVAC